MPKFLLWFSALGFTGFGLACLLMPSMITELSGVNTGSGDAYADISAMYGGAQIGIGLFLLLGALKPAYFRPALLLLAISIGAVAVSRLYGTLFGPGEVGFYTWSAMSFEFIVAALAVIALKN